MTPVERAARKTVDAVAHALYPGTWWQGNGQVYDKLRRERREKVREALDAAGLLAVPDRRDLPAGDALREALLTRMDDWDEAGGVWSNAAAEVRNLLAAHPAQPLPAADQRDEMADWLGALPEAHNVSDMTDEATTVLTIDVDRLADLLLARAAADEAGVVARVFTVDEVVEIANETSDSLGNLYRLDFIDRIQHEAALATGSGTQERETP